MRILQIKISPIRQTIYEGKLINIATDTAQRAGIHAVTMREVGHTAGIKSSIEASGNTCF